MMADASRLPEQVAELTYLLQGILEERDHEINVLSVAFAESRRRAEENLRRISDLEEEVRRLTADLAELPRESREGLVIATNRPGQLIMFAVILYLPVLIFAFFRLF